MTADASVRFRWIQAIAVVGMILLAVMLILPAMQQARESARRTQSKNNLKQIWLALGNYVDTYQHLPAGGTFDSEGGGYHGWLTTLLPYLDSAPLTWQIDFQQPWDAPYNAGCFHLRFPVMFNPSIDGPPLDGFPVTHYSANSNLLSANSSAKWSDVLDQSQTFVAAELGGDFVPWGCPYNWRPLRTLTDTPRTYGRIENRGCHFVLVDGSVRWIGADVPEGILVALRGSNPQQDAATDLHVRRPSAFPYPANARSPWPSSNHRPNPQRDSTHSR